MDKSYDPQLIEQHWATVWETNKFSQPTGDGAPYCIMLPPPNVTGTLHMGHGFQHTLMDALIRKHRMEGRRVLWQGGTDHAGIATQMVVERQLSQENKTRHDLGREAFIERVWQWREKSGSLITQQIRRLGASIDWTRERFTMDPNISQATTEAFIRLFNEGLIYRGKRLVNWDPKLNTAVADLEVENVQQSGHLWHLRYPIKDSEGYLVVATTRPETMLGDSAVAVHPEDERYQHLIGKSIVQPLTQREIPIIADEYVDREFGTGCVKITPAHDFNDYEMGKRHHLPMINVLTFDAHLNDSVPEKYRGLERFKARDIIIKDLEALNLIEKIEPHTNNVPTGDRSGVIIEPMLTDQWYVKSCALAKPAIEAVTSGNINFVPENWAKTYLLWLEGIQDWCISRQLWWGHRIPVWYDIHGHAYVGYDEADARRRAKLTDDIELNQDEDVLDTWFSASLWPFATLDWPNPTPEFETFYPTSVLVTGFDIIFFWVARMVMMGLKLANDIPFKTVYITGLIRDSQGQKMSKTKGNVLDPIDLIDGISLDALIQKRCSGLMQPQMAEKIKKATEKEFPIGIKAHGTDALRFTFCALATTGRDINFDMSRLEGYRNFCNKIWNATRYVLMNTEDKDFSDNNIELSFADQWIRSEIEKTITRVNECFDQYRFDMLAQTLYEFIWNEYCDWYLELSKCVLNNPSATEAQLRGTRRTLLEVLETMLRLLHPLMPYITEEIWQKIAPMVGRGGKSIMIAPYPKLNTTLLNPQILTEAEQLKKIIIAIRTIRSEMNVSPAKQISVIFKQDSNTVRNQLADYDLYIKSLARISDITWHDKGELPPCATAIVDDLEIHIPLAGLIDKSAELSRLKKEIEKLQKEIDKSNNKLNNASYVEKAPADIVSQERDRLEQFNATLQKLREQMQKIEQV